MKAVIFDLDGTLLDNEWVYDRAFCAVLKGLNISCEQLNHTPGIGVKENWKRMVANLQIARDPQELATQTQQFYLEHLDEVNLRPGAVDLLRSLKRRKIKTILATSSVAEVVQRVLELTKTAALFDSQTHGDEVARKKPAPDIFFKAMDKENLLPHETIIIEDSPAGIEAGKAADATVIALKTDLFTRDQLFRADRIAASFAEIAQLLHHNRIA